MAEEPEFLRRIATGFYFFLIPVGILFYVSSRDSRFLIRWCVAGATLASEWMTKRGRRPGFD